MFYSLEYEISGASFLCNCEGYLVESQYFRKFHSQSLEKTRNMNTDQSSLTSRSTEAAYL